MPNNNEKFCVFSKWGSGVVKYSDDHWSRLLTESHLSFPLYWSDILINAPWDTLYNIYDTRKKATLAPEAPTLGEFPKMAEIYTNSAKRKKLFDRPHNESM